MFLLPMITKVCFWRMWSQQCVLEFRLCGGTQLWGSCHFAFSSSFVVVFFILLMLWWCSSWRTAVFVEQSVCLLFKWFWKPVAIHDLTRFNAIRGDAQHLHLFPLWLDFSLWFDFYRLFAIFMCYFVLETKPVLLGIRAVGGQNYRKCAMDNVWERKSTGFAPATQNSWNSK